MKITFLGLAAVSLATIGLAQQSVRVITRPEPLSREALARLNLDAHWLTRIKLANGQDGIFTLQLIPGAERTHLVAQTVAGDVVLLDGETGDVLWRMRLPEPLRWGVAYNGQSIVVVRGDWLYLLNRRNGLHRVYTKLPEEATPTYGFRLANAPSAAPLADEAGVFLAMGNRVTHYAIPDYEALEGLEETPLVPSMPTESSLQPALLWAHDFAGPKVEQAPLATASTVCTVTHDGLFLGLDRFRGLPAFEFRMPSDIIAPMNFYGRVAYVGGEDYALYALDMDGERLYWRFLTGAPIYRRPQVTERDVFVFPNRRGMYRIVRDNGREVWVNRQADEFLAFNPRIVYARDKHRNLLFLDALRGTTLAMYDMRDWTIGVPNEWTDRVYLAAQDGQIQCLRHRAYPTPVHNRPFGDVKIDEQKQPAPKKDEMDKQDEEKIGRAPGQWSQPRPASLARVDLLAAMARRS